jgi:hypothetical protein
MFATFGAMMLGTFPDPAKAEGIEVEALVKMFAAAPAEFAAAADFKCQSFGTITAFVISSMPTPVFNRAQRTGALEPEDRDIEAAVAWMREHASPSWSLQMPESAPDRSEHLARLGLAPSTSWTKFARSTDDPPAASTELEVRAVGEDGAADFGSVTQAAFGLPPAFAQWSTAMIGPTGFTHYVAYQGSTPVAAASLYVSGDIGWLGNGCCLPAYRRSGAQSALLARRIADAAKAGVTTVVTETGTPPPGELANHPSYRNITRSGFKPIYQRIIWRPALQPSQ